MQFTLLFVLMNPAPSVDAWSIGGAKTAVTAAKNFLTGTRKTKSLAHGTPLSQTSPGSVNTSGESDGIMKKSVDFLSNAAMTMVGVDTVVDLFKPDEPVSLYHTFSSSIIHSL